MMVKPMTVASVSVELDAHCGMVKTNTMSTAMKTQLVLVRIMRHVLAVTLGEDAARQSHPAYTLSIRLRPNKPVRFDDSTASMTMNGKTFASPPPDGISGSR